MPLKKFLQYIKFEKRYSPHTVSAYESDLNQFALYLNTQYQTSDFSQVNHFYVRSWLVSLIEAHISSRSINRKITVLKSFYKFLLREHQIVINPMIKIQSPKNSKRLPVFIDKTKIKQVLSDDNFNTDFEGLRNKLIMEMFYNTGMRVSELTNLKMNDLNQQTCSIKVLGSGVRKGLYLMPCHLIVKYRNISTLVLKN